MMPFALRMEPPALISVQRHAARAHPEECCGFLVGDRNRAEPVVTDAWPAGNERSPGERISGYMISPEAYLRTETRARERGASILGVYHSHPGLPPDPSSADLEEAWPDFFYLIWETRGGRPGRFRVWRLAEDRSRFLPAPIRTGGGRNPKERRRP
ncbi:MAG: M67 family metallopeptidase [Candidatus Eisenbacteria bacterium]